VDDLEHRLFKLEAKSLAHSIAISASLLSIYGVNHAELHKLRETICDGIEKAYEREGVSHEFLQIALDEVETLFRLFTARIVS
jgi:hypothetical protein